ncbi:hypothetical protein CDIK_0867 [Cucumispora dikerogammari]|nr:hypothetical protein CDIK_0867 [Cucumispora dikerogammari]
MLPFTSPSHSQSTTHTQSSTHTEAKALEKIKYSLNTFTITDGIKYGVHYLLYTDTPDKVHSKYSLLYKEDFNTSEAIVYQRVSSAVGKEFIVGQFMREEEYVSSISNEDNDVTKEEFKYLRIKRFM